MSFNYDLVLRAAQSPLYSPSLDLALELTMILLADGQSQVKAVFPPQSYIFLLLEQSVRGHDFLGRNKSIICTHSWSFQESLLSSLPIPSLEPISPCSMVGHLLRVWLGKLTGSNKATRTQALWEPALQREAGGLGSKFSSATEAWPWTGPQPFLASASSSVCSRKKQNSYCSTWEGRAWYMLQISPSKVLPLLLMDMHSLIPHLGWGKYWDPLG